MNHLQFQKIGFWLLLILALIACKQDDENTCCDPTNPECVNYDPCHAAIKTSAGFKFLDKLGFGADAEWREEPFLLGGDIKFSAVDTSAYSYTWYLGVDTFIDVKDVVLGIGNLPNGTYGASLVVEKAPNLNCFPDDTGRDSLYQTFTKIDFCDVLVFGTFKGLLNNANDSITIEILNLFPDNLEPCPNFGGAIFCVNILGNSDTLTTSLGPYSYSKLYLDGNGSGAPGGTLVLNPENNKIDLEFRFDSVDHTFKGVKIQ